MPQKQTEHGSGKRQISFVVSGFSQTDVQISAAKISAVPGLVSAASDSLKYHIDHIYMIVETDSSGVFTTVESTSQLSNDPNFGRINLELLPGDYFVYIVGSRGAVHVRPGGNCLCSPFVNWDRRTSVTDVFSIEKKIRVTDESASYPVMLSRIVGQLELELMDGNEMPYSSITVEISQEAYSSYLSRDIPSKQLFQYFPLTLYQSNDEGTDTVGRSFRTIILNTSDKKDLSTGEKLYYITVTITGRTAQGDVQKVIDSVTFQENRRTLLKGYLFRGNRTNFSVDIDGQWKEVPVRQF